uniref:Uncharacterized protein n=1 Tax=Glycine max TaxID=3847 RepID=K7K7C1_SOYBN
MALLILNQEINKLQGVRKALSVLSKALDNDPSSVVLWFVYLLIYYGNLKPNEKDDMFLSAVKLCEESYVLWLMYINSRGKLADRLVAYDSALSVLCQHTSANLFLQMMHCLCMSGNVEKAIERSYGIFSTTTKSNESHHLSLLEILNCLTVSDKCVFWVCCVYLVIYRRLPDAVQKFESEKGLLDNEWPFVTIESIDSFVYRESVKSEVNLRSAQLFALNHLRCMAALDNKECFRDLLDKYVEQYPSCIELVLASALIQKQDINVDSFMGFEEAINRWSIEVPGIQCIWNQYIENAIHNRRIDLAKAITIWWFKSIWQVQVQNLPNGGMEITDDGNSCGSLGLDSKSNDKTAACIALDKAKSTASFGGLEQCIKTYVMFLVYDAWSLKEDGSDGAIKKNLELYADGSSQALLVPKVLTRKFVDSIKKPRLWFGSSILPQTVSDPKHLVDFVEAIMEVVPHNFPLAIVVCKLLTKEYNSDSNSASLWFWACSSLLNAILDAMPIPPEYVWVEAAELLHNSMGIETICDRFYRRALSVYPFSIMLWKSFY